MVARFFHYKKYDASHLESLLWDGTIRFSNPSDFNDPWDCRMNFTLPADNSDRELIRQYFRKVWINSHDEDYIKRNIIDEIINDKIRLRRLLDNIAIEAKNKLRVYCITANCDCPLMWGHYADRHAGICLEFDARCHPFTEGRAVEYRDTFPAFDVHEAGDSALYTKSSDWEYEQEFRLVSTEDEHVKDANPIRTQDGFLQVPQGALKSIIIGCQVKELERTQIRRMVESKGVLVRQADLDPEHYRLKISPPFNP